MNVEGQRELEQGEDQQEEASVQEPVKAEEAPDKIVRIEVRADGVAVITLDDPKESHNTITPKLGQALLAAIDRVATDVRIVAAVIVSGKPQSFVVGANIGLLRAIRFAAEAERMARELSSSLTRIARLQKPIVAAVHGQALGGGFELALACRAIVASDDERTTVGLPEVQLGLLPGANGLLRVAERAGLQVALDLGLTGKPVRARRALKLGLVDEVCPRAVLLEAAARRALSLVEPRVKPSAAKPAIERLEGIDVQAILLEKNPIGRAILFKKARDLAMKKTRGHYPAVTRIIDVLERFGRKGFSAAADLEARLFGELVVSETSQRLIELFFAETALRKDDGTDVEGTEPHEVRHVTVLGGGLMGGGIAFISAKSGFDVRIKERDDEGVGRGLRYVRGILDERLKKGQITALERDEQIAHLTATSDLSGLRHTDVVIEAVFEDLALKQAMLREVETETKETCIFASNTSSIPIAKIAAVSKRPEQVVGMHYFSPVHKMPLLEVVRTDKTTPEVIATVVALGKKQGKTVIVVKDGVGFYTSRVLAPYLNEAAHLVTEGVRIEDIDEALLEWGFPVGPIQLLDEVGIDVGAHVGEIVHEAFGDRMLPPAAMAKLVADERKGKKNGRGFYLYGAAKKSDKRAVDPSVYTVLGVTPRLRLPREEIQMRCALAFVNEALLCLGEGILRSPRDGDIGAIFGLGFPPFRGGPFRYVDVIGAAEILRRVQAYGDRFGKRWTPAPLLVEMAKRGARFYE